MKKVTLILSALALVLGLSQCKKQEEPVQNGEKQHVVLTANNGNDGSKVAASFASAALNLTWEGNETITVSGGASGTLTYKSGVGTPNATFEGDITIDRGGDIVFTIGSAPSSYANQAGTADGCAAWIKGNNHFVGTSQWQDDGNYNVTMELQYAVLKLDVSTLGTTGEMTIAAGATVASVADVTSSVGKVVFVAVPTDETEKAYTITCDGKTATKTWALEKNVFYTKDDGHGAGTGNAIVIEPDAPATSKFSVSETTTVEFAPGNLYWDGSSWKFEANQWDFRHYYGTINDAAVIGGESTTTPAGTVGSFFWSKTASVAYAASYSESGTTTSDVFFTNGQSFQVAGETAGTWHTLSYDEWGYLLNTRTNAESLRAWVTLTDVNVSGLVILPDESDETASGVITTVLVAASGAVFLPAAGNRDRNGTDVDYVGWVGHYWSSTPGDSFNKYANSMNFVSNYDAYMGLGFRDYGYAVRLVRDITE